jgi:hypothetical protein
MGKSIISMAMTSSSLSLYVFTRGYPVMVDEFYPVTLAKFVHPWILSRGMAPPSDRLISLSRSEWGRPVDGRPTSNDFDLQKQSDTKVIQK